MVMPPTQVPGEANRDIPDDAIPYYTTYQIYQTVPAGNWTIIMRMIVRLVMMIMVMEMVNQVNKTCKALEIQLR